MSIFSRGNGFGCCKTAQIGTMGGREEARRAGFPGEKEAAVDRRRQLLPVVGMAGKSEGIGAERPWIDGPGRARDPAKALRERAAEESGELVTGELRHGAGALRFEPARQRAAEIGGDHGPAVRAKLVAAGRDSFCRAEDVAVGRQLGRGAVEREEELVG